MTLAEAKDGQHLIILDTGSKEIMVQALRFGLDNGSRIMIEKNIRGGPVIVSKNQLEIAIGREIAEKIKVQSL